MKKLSTLIAALMILSISSFAWAAAPNPCTVTPSQEVGGYVKISLACTGDAAGAVTTTTIPSATMDLIKMKMQMVRACAYPTSGGPAPDAADVFVMMDGRIDLLGSVDGGTTANKGANLIHATLEKCTWPYNSVTASYDFIPIDGDLTVTFANQVTNGAKWNLDLLFAR